MNERVLLIDVDSHNFPNLVLMKLSAYHKAEGNTVNFIKLTPEDKKLILTGQPMWFDGEYDRIYAACVFTCKWIFHSIDKFEDYVPIKWKRHLEMMVNTKNA